MTFKNTPNKGEIDSNWGINSSNWDHPSHLALSQRHMDKMMPVRYLQPGQTIDLPRAELPLDLEALPLHDPLTGKPMAANDFLNRRLFNDACMVVHRGQVLHESYRNGMRPEDHHVQHSTTKSLIAMLVGIAIAENKVSPDIEVAEYIPELRILPAWQGVTLQHVLDMATGIEYSEDYADPNCPYFSYAQAVGYAGELSEARIGHKAWMLQHMTSRSSEPGAQFCYTSPLTNVLGMVISVAYDRDFLDVLEEKIYCRIGAEAQAWFNTDDFGVAIAEGQLSLRLRDFARWALLMINGGKNLLGEQVLPPEFIADTLTVRESSKEAFAKSADAAYFPGAQYRNQFWVLSPEQQQYAMLGIHGQTVWYDQRQELMILGYGSYPVQDDALLFAAWQQLNAAILTAVR
ncbi:beta-lactamase family protein [Aestuariicella sp. G3-2]|uniref:serine hydrolase domain-containing protein n=1 Tax=Pseudomaricurvus albidus TaxID=2842452 RepID=UPI001C0E83DA|nr:serine hydrolase [Aestuariicella albida]MBU3068390.1 beta-lactamase family protein [Aestuariicella albida]